MLCYSGALEGCQVLGPVCGFDCVAGVDMLVDVHGDEELPYCFIAGSEGISGWSERMQMMQVILDRKMLLLIGLCMPHPKPQSLTPKPNPPINHTVRSTLGAIRPAAGSRDGGWNPG